MARLRTSGENVFVVLLTVAPVSQKLEPPANPERFHPFLCHATYGLYVFIRTSGNEAAPSALGGTECE